MRSVADVLPAEGIRLGLSATDKWDAIRQCGAVLLELDAVEPGYPETMLEREKSVSTFIGEGVAIPHGTLAGKELVHRDALSFVRFPDGVDWGGQPATIAIGIAAKGDGHVELLARIAELLLDPGTAAALREVTNLEDLRALLAEEDEE